MMVVWKPGLNWHKFLQFHFYVYSSVLVSIEMMYQILKCFIGYPNTLNFVKNTLLHKICLTLLSVFEYPNETVSYLIHFIHYILSNELRCGKFISFLFLWLIYCSKIYIHSRECFNKVSNTSNLS